MKFLKNKVRTILLLLVVALSLTFTACAGLLPQKEPFKLTMVEEAFRPPLYIEEEYSIENLVVKEKGVTYDIEDLFYFDDSFEKISLEYKDGKFTQNNPYDVIITVVGKKDGMTDKETLELKINFTPVPVLDTINSSWNDEGVIKSLSATSKYLKDGAKTALVTRYIGTLGGMDGVSYGNLTKALGSCSITDWSNAVFTMDVYNDTDYSVFMGWQITKDKQDYNIELFKTEIPAKSWGKVAWSFRAIGYNKDYFTTGEGGFSFKASPDKSVAGPYDFTFAICNVDVTDYSAERFPDLETRTIAEINQDKYDALQGDALDKAMVSFTTYTPNFDATTDTDVKKEGESSVKYTFTKDVTKNYPTVNRGNFLEALNGELDEYFTSLTEWEDVRVGFWVKTDYKLNVAVRFRNTQDGVEYKGSGDMEFGGYYSHKDIYASTEWQYVEFRLNELIKGLYTTDVTGYQLVLCNESVLANDGDSLHFYIDGLTVYSVHVEKVEGDADDLAVYENSAREHSKYLGLSATEYSTVAYGAEGLQKPTDLTSTYYVKADVTYTGNDCVSVPVLFDEGMPAGYIEGTDYSDAYIGMWIYNDTSTDVTIYFMKGDECDQYPSIYSSTAQKAKLKAGEWTYVEFSLAQITTQKFGVMIWKWYEATQTNASAIYCIDGFSIYTGSKLAK